jgi:hypothetical protein
VEKKFNQFSLREAAKFDHETGQRDKLTGWGKVSKDREKRGISRRLRRQRHENS